MVRGSGGSKCQLICAKVVVIAMRINEFITKGKCGLIRRSQAGGWVGKASCSISKVLQLAHDVVGNAGIGIDLLYIIQIFQHINQSQHFFGMN